MAEPLRAELCSPVEKERTQGAVAVAVTSTLPYKRQDVIKWSGWGYKDSQFVVGANKNLIRMSGNRYPICNQDLSYFIEWVQKKFAVDTEKPLERQTPDIPLDYTIPESRISDEQLGRLKALGVKTSVEGVDRVFRAHGQSLHEILNLRHNTLQRIPDAVVWPESHEDVVRLVRLADDANIVIIPYGGGTSVSGAVECPGDEDRPIVSLDTSRMNNILWISEESLVACCEGGIIGQDMERELKKRGYTCGHEPDSIEFSTLGGWVATAASGMKMNAYGNIEDMVVHVRMVTPRGVLEKSTRAPRMSCGPNFNYTVIGSEGSLGVITEVVVKIRPLPPVRRYGSIVFPDFETGIRCLREITRRRCQPASLRLMDHEQFQMGRALRSASSYFGIVLESMKTFYINKIKGFDLDKMCLATLLFEGTKENVLAQEKIIHDIALSYGAVPAGEQNGLRGYRMTFVIAYIRDIALEYNILSESVETSVPWELAAPMVRAVRAGIAAACRARGVQHHSTMCRVAQVYDAGCCLYFYFVFNADGLRDGLSVVHELEALARDDIVAMGGSISHHHGVGKLRRKWYERTVSAPGQNLFRAAKLALDPNNIFATRNLVADLTHAPCKL